LESTTILYLGDGPNSSGSELTVENGAKMVVQNQTQIGRVSGGNNNILTITGSGSRFESAGNVAVGQVGSGNELIIEDGGVFTIANDKQLYIGNNASSNNNKVTVTGEGSLLSAGPGVTNSYVGLMNGTGNQLIVSDGGKVSTPTVYSGLSGGTGHSITVTTNGILEARTLQTGHDSSNTITASNGGVFQFTRKDPGVNANGGAITLGNKGVLSYIDLVDARTSAVTGLTYTGTEHTLRLNNAQNAIVSSYALSTSHTYSRLELMNNAVWKSSGSLLVGTGGSLAGSGTVEGTVTIDSGGMLEIGQSPGTMIFEGDLTFNLGSVSTFEIDGFDPGFFDLAQGGDGVQTVSFGGTLNLAFAQGFQTEGTVQIFDFENYSNTFETVHVSGLAQGYVASFNETTGFVTVEAIPEPSSWVLICMGLGLFLVCFKKRCLHPAVQK